MPKDQLKPFWNEAFLDRVDRRRQRGNRVDRLLLHELGATPVGPLVQKSTTLKSLNVLGAAYIAKHLPDLVERKRSDAQEVIRWKKFEARVIDFAQSKPDFSVVQIGAHDGTSNDRLHPLFVKYGWQGLLVEPLNEPFKKLQTTYQSQPNIHLAQCAITSVDGPVQMFRVDPLSDAPESAQQCASTKRSVVESFPYVAKKGIVTEVVQGATLDTLFRETGVTNPDLLFVDAEGCDYDILTQLADSSVTPPPFMVLEHDHMTGSQITSSNQILDAMGYQIDQLTHDLVAFRA